jgi:hypothetical protein
LINEQYYAHEEDFLKVIYHWQNRTMSCDSY